jgi:CDP-diacylglycerol--inositol 3-phosphatidyltransferase
MAAAKSRRQGAAAASPEPKAQDKEVVAGANGSPSIQIAGKKESADEEPHENIFLLWPNIIGENCAAATAALNHVKTC